MQNQKKVWNKIAPEWSQFRQKPVKEVEKFLKKQKGKILDLGSGSGRHLLKSKNSKMYLVDFSKEMIRLAKEKNIPAEFKISRLHKIPYPKNYFNSSICIAALHCIPTKRKRAKVVKELHRVLKPGAQAMISVWNKNTSWFKNPKKENYIDWREKGKRYYYYYAPLELKKDLEDIGFKIMFEKFSKTEPNITFIIQK